MPALLEPPAPVAAASALRSGLTLFVAGRVAARTARRLGAQGDGTAAQAAVLRERLAALARTAFGAAHGLTAGTRCEEFAARVPLRAYEQFAPWIERMKRGETDILHPGRCAYFAVSSGTTAGPSKYLPVNAAMLRHFRDTGLDSLFCYAARTGHSRVFLGRHLFLGGATSLQPMPEAAAPTWAGDLSGITAANLPAWVQRQLYEPGVEIAAIADWPEKLRAIAHRTLDRNITLAAGIPSWLLVLAETLRAAAAERGRSVANVAELWPRLECLVHGGVPLAPFAARLREAFGAQVNFHEVYPASEGFIAVQDAGADEGLRLLADRGIFYEFLPLDDYRHADAATQAARAVPLAGVKVGVDYVLLLTTPAGLTRYVIGDVVRFTGTTPPRLVYAGRTRLELSAFGEHVIEKELTDTVTAACARLAVPLADFHVAPLFPDPAAGRARGAHEWWIEPAGPVPAGSGGALAAELDAGLAARNDDYAAKRQGGGLLAPVVRLVPPGGFAAWLKQAGKWGGQNKLPRCRSDRRIADALAGLPPDRR